MMLKCFPFLIFILFLAFETRGQTNDCVFKAPAITIHFGSGNIADANNGSLWNYDRLYTSCPPDGYYSFKPYTSQCFSDDWHTLTEDHTPGDVDGNMLLVNGAPNPGIFFKTNVGALKPGTIYEFGVWLMNLCKPSDKCPFPLLPNISIRLETAEGKIIANIVTGEIVRVGAPHWTQHRAVFTTPATPTSLTLLMADNTPGGCGNDFAMDDITFRECVKTPPPITTIKKPNNASTSPKKTDAKKATVAAVKPPPKKTNPAPAVKEAKVSQVAKPSTDSSLRSIAVVKPRRNIFTPLPLVLTTRENSLVKRIETDAGEIRIDLYDNGEIDGDTVSVYHNNALIKSKARLSEKPISFTIAIDTAQPHHELIMVADNLGSIPPNTSVMIVTAGANRYQVFISSTETKNAKVILDLKK